MTAILTALANISWPMFFLGLAIFIGCTIAALVVAVDRADNKVSITDDRWIVSQDHIRKLLTGSAIGVAMILTSYAVHGINEPLVRVVEKEVEVQLEPDFERSYNQCLKDDGYNRFKYRDRDMRKEVAATCYQRATDLFEASNKGPVRVIEHTKPRVVYKRIPYREFMEACAPSSSKELTGEVAIKGSQVEIARCQELAVDEMKGLVQGAK